MPVQQDMGRGGKGPPEPNAEVVGDLYIRLMQHVPPPKKLARTMWLSKRTMTSFRQVRSASTNAPRSLHCNAPALQQHPCMATLLLGMYKLFSGGLFVWDVISDALVLAQLSDAGELGLMGLGIAIMCVEQDSVSVALVHTFPTTGSCHLQFLGTCSLWVS